VHAGFWWGNWKGDQLQELGRVGGGVDNIKLHRLGVAWTGLIWLKIGTSGGLL
jgi:hypothetical protein